MGLFKKLITDKNSRSFSLGWDYLDTNIDSPEWEHFSYRNEIEKDIGERMQVKNFKMINKGMMLCSFDLDFPQIGLSIRDFKLCKGKDGSSWISKPCRKYQDSEGKDRFYDYVVIPTEKRSSFEAKVKQLLEPFMALEQSKTPVKDLTFDDSEVPF